MQQKKCGAALTWLFFLLSRYQLHLTLTKATNELAHKQRVILCI